MDTATELRKERQRQQKIAREKIVADRRRDAEIQDRITRQMYAHYYQIDNSWYKTERNSEDFLKWYKDYFGIEAVNKQAIYLRCQFGDNPPVAFDVDRVGY